MDQENLHKLLTSVADGTTLPDEAMSRLRSMPFEDLGFAKVDHHRALRQGHPETIYAEGKTAAQVVDIAKAMIAHESNVLATRCDEEVVRALLAEYPDAEDHAVARCVTITRSAPKKLDGYVAIVCAGTSDVPVAEEAAVSCAFRGNEVKRIYDVGVAGLHRVLDQRETLEKANAIVVCAGMEGALATVVAGLVDVPVIAVPTSVGYGASFGGSAALLGMLIIFGASGDTAFAKGKPTAFSADGLVTGLDGGDVQAAGQSGRFVVQNRIATGNLDAGATSDLHGAFSFTFGTNVPLLTQSGQVHGTVTFAGGDIVANVTAISSFAGVPGGTIVPGFGPVGIVPLNLNGRLTFTSGAQGNGSIDATIWAVIDPVGGHIVGVVPNALDGVLPYFDDLGNFLGFTGISDVSIAGD
ncbi:MAG: nickel pincer cofactor biosynthesis protein LarB, partial [Candidatus Hydrogenedentes bacterium]|nr:nickel pincer cofactor biosynthesis protein LarB [Candidatus Hydrogenedentota bacterium]